MELDSHFHCLTLGTALTVDELRGFARKAGVTVDTDDYALHHRIVQAMDEPIFTARATHKSLDHKSAGTLRCRALYGRRVLYCSDRNRQAAHRRDLVTRRNGKLLHHGGGSNENTATRGLNRACRCSLAPGRLREPPRLFAGKALLQARGQAVRAVTVGEPCRLYRGAVRGRPGAPRPD